MAVVLVRWEPVAPPKMISRSLRLASPPSSNLEEVYLKVTVTARTCSWHAECNKKSSQLTVISETVFKTEELILAKQAESVPARESAAFTIKSVQTWRAVLRRAVAWKTARYTKGDIDATVVGITDADGTMGYGYMPSMSIVGESPLSSEALIQTLLAPIMKDRSFLGIQPVLREIDQVLGANFQTKFAIEEALWDLLAKKLQTPLVNLIGGACRLEVPVMRMLGLKPPQ